MIKNFTIDFLGLANLFKTPTYNVTWWFMSLIILLYILFPVFKKVLDRSPSLFLLGTMFVTFFAPFKFYSMLNAYFLAFAAGMMLFKYNVFDKLRELDKTKTERIILSVIFLAIGLYGRYKIGGIFDAVAAVAIIIACNNILSIVKPVKKSLQFVGVHSSNIFMLHTFIYLYFFPELFTGMPNVFVAFLVLLALSLITSIVIEKMKWLVGKIFMRIKSTRRKVVA